MTLAAALAAGAPARGRSGRIFGTRQRRRGTKETHEQHVATLATLRRSSGSQAKHRQRRACEAAGTKYSQFQRVNP